MVARHRRMVGRQLTVVADTDVRRRHTAAGLQVTAAEERHHMAEAGQLHLTAVAVAARAGPAVAVDTRPLEAEVIVVVVVAEAEATLAVDITEPSHT